MIPVEAYAGMFCPGLRKKRRLVMFRLYCDESYDGRASTPDCFTVSGFFSDQSTWEEVEDEWSAINREYGVTEFHATKLNSRVGQYEGWGRSKAIEYSAKLLHVITRQKLRLVAYNCGVLGDAYRKAISPSGQLKLGHPWIMCFQSCVAMVAKHMETLPVEDRFSVVFGQENRFEGMAVSAFMEMKRNPQFPYRHRLLACAPGDPSEMVPLQVADLMAYEYYKRISQHKATSSNMAVRTPLRLIQETANYAHGLFGEAWFTKNAQAIESAVCGPSQLVVIPNLG